MGRALLIAEYYIQVKHKKKVNGEIIQKEVLYPVYVANSHFESLFSILNKKNRAYQFKDVLGYIF